MKTLNVNKLEFYTQYTQFYISSGEKDALDNIKDEDYSPQNQHKRMIAGQNILAIFTECYGHVKGSLKIFDRKPLNDFSLYDHIVEGSITVENKSLKIFNCPHMEEIITIKIANGHYRVRVMSSNLKSVIDDDGDDFYTIEIWPAPSEDIVVLKQYKNE